MSHRPIGVVLALAVPLLSACEPRVAPLEEDAVPAVAASDELTPPADVPAGMFARIEEADPVLEDNPANPAKVELGKMLFFEPRLSSSWLISCNTCHNVGLAGVDLLPTSVGHGWQRGPRNAPTVLNAVYNVAQFWDGRAEDLEEQAKGPVQAAVEMGSDPDRVVRTLRSIPEYVDRFTEAFPADPDPVSFDNMARAIEVFEATLRTPDSRFDRYLAGATDALSAEEKEGFQLFLSKGCVACHSGVNLGGQGYFPFGVVESPGDEIRPPEDRGRAQVTNTEADDYVFRAPSLRNVELTPPYFHSGSVPELEDAVRVMGSAQLGAVLTESEVARITDFLRTLTGRQPVIDYPLLPPSTVETPPPDLTVRLPAGTH